MLNSSVLPTLKVMKKTGKRKQGRKKKKIFKRKDVFQQNSINVFEKLEEESESEPS